MENASKNANVTSKDVASSKNVKKKNEKQENVERHDDFRARALKAWETIRAKKAAAGQNEKTEKKCKKIKKVIETVVDKVSGNDVGLKADEKREMEALNGVELERMAKQTQNKLDRKQAMDEAKNGHKDLKAVDVGKIIKRAKVERFNGGIKLA